MCVAEGSPDFYTATCPMCKFFRNKERCRHKRETCRNRVNHPQHDIVYIANAEVSTFKGCGYCKWAMMHAPAAKSGVHNTGWPGCCRPPQASELDKIPPADWPAVHAVHRTPIPPDIKQILDSIKLPFVLSPNSPTSPTSPSTITAAHSSTKDSPKAAGIERKSLSRANSSPNGTVRSPPQKTRGSISGAVAGSGNSPQMKQARLAGGAAPGTSPARHAVSLTESNTARRAGADAQKPLKSVEGFRTTPPSSTRKLGADGEQRHSQMMSSSISAMNFSAFVSPEREHLPLKRRGSATATTSIPFAAAAKRLSVTPKFGNKPHDRDTSKVSSEGLEGLEEGLKTLNVSLSSSSSDSSSDSGSRTSSNDTSTVTSDGGFTDYLSDESEAELQRQAEVRAALLEQNRQEEQEFKAARRQLANVDLRPPQAWTVGRKAVANTRGV